MKARTLAIVTPEMVRIDFELAEPGRRLVAFLIDVGLISLVLLASSLLITLVIGGLIGAGLGWALVLVSSFAVRTFYFILFELRHRGRTPGKRLLGLRVIAGDGGPLGPGMVFARNLTREAEIFLPLIVLVAPQILVANAPVWVVVLTITWAGILVLLPFFNHAWARLGDLIAGTVVVREPRSILLKDLLAETVQPEAESPYQFTIQQLDLYGIRELHLLEEMLRQPPSPSDQELLDLICRKIITKIGWPQPASAVASEAFLHAFYAAQRGRLEHKLLLGKRQEHKLPGRVGHERPELRGFGRL